ncbi:hypothetical protein Fmac_006123 [Flemingia macrophylla]|uniref:Uncharacterized protein n=1 Tax=Flemingia macrophylla TaxID=520843 RepID=A0ABD1NB58_9FABA
MGLATLLYLLHENWPVRFAILKSSKAPSIDIEVLSHTNSCFVHCNQRSRSSQLHKKKVKAKKANEAQDKKRKAPKPYLSIKHDIVSDAGKPSSPTLPPSFFVPPSSLVYQQAEKIHEVSSIRQQALELALSIATNYASEATTLDL